MTQQRPEQQLQMQIVEFFTIVLPSDVYWNAVPAGGGGKKRGAIIKAMGYRAGCPDLMLIYNGKAHFIELKAATGRVSPLQSLAMVAIEQAGGRCAVCRSLADVELQLLKWHIPTRMVQQGRGQDAKEA